MKRRSIVFVVGRFLAIPMYKFLFHYKVKGKKNLPKKGAYIVCSNHISNYDPLLISMTQKRQIYYMAKKELFEKKLFAALISELGAFPVDRGAGDGKAIQQAEEIVADGGIEGGVHHAVFGGVDTADLAGGLIVENKGDFNPACEDVDPARSCDCEAHEG